MTLAVEAFIKEVEFDMITFCLKEYENCDIIVKSNLSVYNLLQDLSVQVEFFPIPKFTPVRERINKWFKSALMKKLQDRSAFTFYTFQSILL